jgi:cystathionine gamma-lyase
LAARGRVGNNPGMRKGFGTRAIHAGQAPDPTTGAIMTPVYLTSTYVQEAPARHKGYVYARGDNPTRRAMEACLADLEAGEACVAAASGLGASTIVLADLGAGARVVAGDDLYGGTRRLFERVFRRLGVEAEYVDASDLDAVAAALARKPASLLWIETPTNPLLKITDLRAACDLARARGVPVLVDNTFASPYLQRPLELGADVVLHSLTKYLGGHSDLVGGALVVRDGARAERYRFLANAMGPVPGPLDCFLVLRGMKTLHVRMDRHCDNAEKVVAFLRGHPRVRRVYHPSLPDHPGHAVARRQMARFGAMVSVELDGGVEEAKRFASSTRLFALAESLGGVESLIEHPASMTHASVPAEERRRAGLHDGLLRLSVGIEDAGDLVADLEEAFRKAF